MISSDPNHLLYIEPTGKAAGEPVVDRLTRQMTAAFRRARVMDGCYLGVHRCSCGITSTNQDYFLPDGTMLNSLCVHYLASHRAKVPARQIKRVQRLSYGEAEPAEEELAGDRLRSLQPVDWIGREALERWDNQGLDLRPAFFAMRASPSTGSDVALQYFANVPAAIAPIWAKSAQKLFGETDSWASRIASRPDWKNHWVPILLDMLNHEHVAAQQWACATLGMMCSRPCYQVLESAGLPRAFHEQVGRALEDLSTRDTAVREAATLALMEYRRGVTQGRAKLDMESALDWRQRTILDYLSIRVTPKGIAEVQWGEQVVFIPIQKIRSVDAGYGFIAERPILQALLGLGFCGIALYGLVAAGLAVASYGSVHLWIRRMLIEKVLVLAGMSFFLAFGLWGIRNALRRGPYILVVTNREQRKLGLRGNVDATMFSDFISLARDRLLTNSTMRSKN